MVKLIKFNILRIKNKINGTKMDYVVIKNLKIAYLNEILILKEEKYDAALWHYKY